MAMPGGRVVAGSHSGPRYRSIPGRYPVTTGVSLANEYPIVLHDPAADRKAVWRARLSENPYGSPEVRALQEKIRSIEAKQQQVLDKFHSLEEVSSEKATAAELAFGKEVEKIREGDLATKKKIKQNFAQECLESQSEEEERMEILERQAEKEYEASEQHIISEFERRERSMREEHEGVLEGLKIKLQALKRRQLQSTETALMGMDLLEAGGRGVKVAGMQEHAAEAGVQAGDVIVNLQPSCLLEDQYQFDRMAMYAKPGDTLAALVQRAGSHSPIEIAFRIPQ